MVWYLPLKLSVAEDGLTAETGLIIKKNVCGIGPYFHPTCHLLNKLKILKIVKSITKIVLTGLNTGENFKALEK